jgi:hypothetical protein
VLGVLFSPSSTCRTAKSSQFVVATLSGVGESGPDAGARLAAVDTAIPHDRGAKRRDVVDILFEIHHLDDLRGTGLDVGTMN